MCGIIGYAGKKEAQPILLSGLQRLEYRGYDSAGIAVMHGSSLNVVKSEGRLQRLRDRLEDHALHGSVGIGHTRWATHGEPSDANAHPHMDASGEIAVVHNGIIENHRQLREMLEKDGITFRSDTDTEVIAHLLGLLDQGDMRCTLQRIQRLLEGSYALCVLTAREPGSIFLTRHNSPLVIGTSDEAQYVASDVPAILPYTRDVIYMQDGDIAVITDDSVRLYSKTGDPLPLVKSTVSWSIDSAEKGGFDHFMLKEIYEEPEALGKTLHAHADLQSGCMRDGFLGMTSDELLRTDRILLTACGTAYHAAVAGKYILEKLTGIPADVDIASEFRYREPVLSERTLCVFLSQSGETADTLAAMKESLARRARLLAITNVVGSSAARLAGDQILYTFAGPEIAVASTKAYITQVELLTLLAAEISHRRGRMGIEAVAALLTEMDDIPRLAKSALLLDAEISPFAKECASVKHVFFIGRGLDYALAMEASLKLKEVSYVFSEAYAAGELKHGTIALIEPGTLVIAVATQTQLISKLLSNIREIRSRGARVAVVTLDSLKEQFVADTDVIFSVPNVSPVLTPLLAVIPLQLFAYHMAVCRGRDVDQPRNLAKSVTVE